MRVKRSLGRGADGGLDRGPEPLLIGCELQAGLDRGDAGIDEAVEVVLAHAGTAILPALILGGRRRIRRRSLLRQREGARAGQQGRKSDGGDGLHADILRGGDKDKIAPILLSPEVTAA